MVVVGAWVVVGGWVVVADVVGGLVVGGAVVGGVVVGRGGRVRVGRVFVETSGADDWPAKAVVLPARTSSRAMRKATRFMDWMVLSSRPHDEPTAMCQHVVLLGGLLVAVPMSVTVGGGNFVAGPPTANCAGGAACVCGVAQVHGCSTRGSW